MNAIHQRAIVISVQKGGLIRLHLQDLLSHDIIARPCGDMQAKSITLVAGDEVTVEISPYDLHRGRIIWRHDV